MSNGFDPEGDGPEFRRDQSVSQLNDADARAFAIKMAKARRGPKPKVEKKPNEKKIQKGIERQRHMNATQFRESEDERVNPHFNPNDMPASSRGGAPKPPEKKEEDEE